MWKASPLDEHLPRDTIHTTMMITEHEGFWSVSGNCDSRDGGVSEVKLFSCSLGEHQEVLVDRYLTPARYQVEARTLADIEIWWIQLTVLGGVCVWRQCRVRFLNSVFLNLSLSKLLICWPRPIRNSLRLEHLTLFLVIHVPLANTATFL